MQILRHLSCVLLIFAITVIGSAAGRKKAEPQSQPPPPPDQNQQISIDSVDNSAVARGETVTVNGKFPAFEKIIVHLEPRGWSQINIGNNANPSPSPGPSPNPY